MGAIDAVLFDLDGTVVDSAPDMARALNVLRANADLPPLDVTIVRPHVTRGARGMLQVGFGLTPDAPQFDDLREQFYQLYEADLAGVSAVFPGMETVLNSLAQQHIRCGVVTNKAARLALPLMGALGLDKRMDCIVCGDTTPHTKPHPAPLLHAATLIGIPPNRCLYVGDDLRDIQAAQACNMVSVAVRYGYGSAESDPASWLPNHCIDSPEDLIALLR